MSSQEPGSHGASTAPTGERVMEATPFFRMRVRIAPSELPGAGLGAFALEAVAKGTLLGLDLPHATWLVSAEDALQLPEEARSQTWRHVGDICFCGHRGVESASNYLNHSFRPNVFWHLGCFWALEDLHLGDELLLDYRPLMDPRWSGRVVDSATGRPLIGKEGNEALLENARALVALLESVVETEEAASAGNLPVAPHGLPAIGADSPGPAGSSTL